MSTATLEAPATSEPTPQPFPVNRRLSDRAFRGLLIAGGLTSLVVLSAIFGYLALRSEPILREFGLDFVFTAQWYVGDDTLPSAGSADPARFGLLAMMWGSLLISVLTLLISVPLGVLVALAGTFFLPRPLAKVLTAVVDGVAAIPSVVVGLWGFFVLVPHAAYVASFINANLGWIPIFGVNFPAFEQSPFVAAIVLSVMVIPIVAAVSREVFSQTPPDLVSAAYALGATKVQMIRKVAFPFGRGGVVGGAMLGLGRALGETVAVFFVLQLIYDQVNWGRILESEGGNVASLIVARFSEATELEINALFGAGLLLFFMTLLANMLANVIINVTTRRTS